MSTQATQSPDVERRTRSWRLSVAAATVITGLILAVAIVVNLLIPGRVMHWDIVGIIGGVAVVGLAVGLRLRLL